VMFNWARLAVARLAQPVVAQEERAVAVD
jgi:hypothetical protein